MKKFLSFLVLIPMMFGIISCSAVNHTIFSKKYNTDPRESFVYISIKHTMTVCTTDDVCVSNDFKGSASGVIFKRSYKSSYILTAAHVCGAPALESQAMLMGGKLESAHEVTTLTGRTYKTEVVSLDHSIDICTLFVPGLSHMPPIPRASEQPKPGDKIINIAAPLGVFETNVVPIMTGVYIGDKKDGGALYSLPAAGGSSGSMILNGDGELIGVLFATHIGMNQLTLGTSFKETNKFIYESIKKQDQTKMIKLIARVIQKGTLRDPKLLISH
jgi:S1-C subfamily serine protease